MNSFRDYLAVGCAGFLGAIARYFISVTCLRWFGPMFPVGTLVINLSGSFALGWFLTAIQNRIPVSDTFRLAVAVGFIGAYTTFSTFMVESDALLRDGAFARSAAYLVGSVVLGLLSVQLGIWVGKL